MTTEELLKLFEKAGKRAVAAGTPEAGVVISPDLEGRLYYIRGGQVASRVNPKAIAGLTDRSGYLNPGGDGLWPAPEGTCFGYEYSTGAWRVPPGLTGARFKVVSKTKNSVEIEGEVDLANASMLAVPTIFRRKVTVSSKKGVFTAVQKESIEYIGSRTLGKDEVLLAPWSLCQFDSTPESFARFPAAAKFRDFYGDSSEFQTVSDGIVQVASTKKQRWQVALNKKFEWVELVLPKSGIVVRRTSAALPAGQKLIDIADAPVDRKPDGEPVRFSVYSDPSGFMEIEAAGGCRFPLKKGTVLSFEITTEIRSL